MICILYSRPSRIVKSRRDILNVAIRIAGEGEKRKIEGTGKCIASAERTEV